jgi:outer membrane translocation and assembly module TamA
MLTSFRYFVAAACTAMAVASAIPITHAEAPAAKHLKVLTERAAKIVVALQLEDPEQAARVRDLIAQQYLAVGKLHDAGNVEAAELDALHRRFLARLGAELTPEQVDVVKDGMTYGVVSITLNGYQELLPQLTAEQRREIHAQLLEAREYAMDASSSEAKHATFGKYKGRINNYLSKAGYELKQAEAARAARVSAESPTR